MYITFIVRIIALNKCLSGGINCSL